MILICCKCPEISRFIIYYEQTVVFLDCFRPHDYGEVSQSRKTVITLFMSFISFWCDFLPSMIFTNAVNIALHWICIPLTYKIDKKFQYIVEFIYSVVALNVCLIVVAIVRIKFQTMLKNFEKIVQVHMELLNGLTEGFIALT